MIYVGSCYTEALFGWLIDWYIDCLMDWLIGVLIDRLIDWLIGLIDGLIDWLIRLIDGLIGIKIAKAEGATYRLGPELEIWWADVYYVVVIKYSYKSSVLLQEAVSRVLNADIISMSSSSM